MNEWSKMISGLPYDMSKVAKYRANARALCNALNNTAGPYAQDSSDYKSTLLSLLPFANVNTIIELPFFCDYGMNITIGQNVFINAYTIILDAALVTIGHNVLIGPHVQIYASTHPIYYKDRQQNIGIAKAITIGNDCWIGGNATICPGVTLGQRTIVAAGSVVTKSFQSDVLIAGNPAKIIKHLANET